MIYPYIVQIGEYAEVIIEAEDKESAIIEACNNKGLIVLEIVGLCEYPAMKLANCLQFEVELTTGQRIAVACKFDRKTFEAEPIRPMASGYSSKHAELDQQSKQRISELLNSAERIYKSVAF